MGRESSREKKAMRSRAGRAFRNPAVGSVAPAENTIYTHFAIFLGLHSGSAARLVRSYGGRHSADSVAATYVTAPYVSFVAVHFLFCVPLTDGVFRGTDVRTQFTFHEQTCKLRLFRDSSCCWCLCRYVAGNCCCLAAHRPIVHYEGLRSYPAPTKCCCSYSHDICNSVK